MHLKIQKKTTKKRETINSTKTIKSRLKNKE